MSLETIFIYRNHHIYYDTDSDMLFNGYDGFNYTEYTNDKYKCIYDCILFDCTDLKAKTLFEVSTWNIVTHNGKIYIIDAKNIKRIYNSENLEFINNL